jgi:hypothetical protein
MSIQAAAAGSGGDSVASRSGCVALFCLVAKFVLYNRTQYLGFAGLEVTTVNLLDHGCSL